MFRLLSFLLVLLFLAPPGAEGAPAFWRQACGALYDRLHPAEAAKRERLAQARAKGEALRAEYFAALAAGTPEAERHADYLRVSLEEFWNARAKRGEGYSVLPMRDDLIGEHLGRRWPHVGHRKVKYFTPEELKAYEVTAGPDGLLRRADGSLLDTRVRADGKQVNKPAIFVMDAEGRIYVYQGPKIEFPPYDFYVLGDPQSGDLVKHSSLTGGLAAPSAGQIKVVEGQVLYLDPQSGHYRPPLRYFEQIKTELKRRGVSLDGAEIQTIR
jgi:hypothetical protein